MLGAWVAGMYSESACPTRTFHSFVEHALLLLHPYSWVGSFPVMAEVQLLSLAWQRVFFVPRGEAGGHPYGNRKALSFLGLIFLDLFGTSSK